MKKIKLYSEVVYLLANALLAMAVAMLSAADFGLSMIVSPAYLLSEKAGFLTFGQSEYVLQAVLFVVFCILMKRVKWPYFVSFITCLIYGALLDGFRSCIPLFNPAVTSPDSIAWWLRLVLFILGILLTAFSVSLSFSTYLYPQVYDFFVKGMSARFRKNRAQFKHVFDLSFLALALIMTFLFFGGFVGVGWGTVLMAVINGPLIGKFTKLLDTYCDFSPRFPRLAEKFELN